MAGDRTFVGARSQPKTRSAIAYAIERHAGQVRRYDGAPYVLHPLEVAALLYAVGAPDEVVAAGALHDTIEKADVGVGELRARFGLRVAALVLAVSDDHGMVDYVRRKAELRERIAGAGPEALMVFAADKISKVRELRRERDPGRGSRSAAADRPPSRRLRLLHYRHSLRLLHERLPGSPLVAQLRRELETLSARPT
jgi:(p)ppGpp synthase/HD superfamily hydrolase